MKFVLTIEEDGTIELSEIINQLKTNDVDASPLQELLEKST